MVCSWYRDFVQQRTGNRAGCWTWLWGDGFGLYVLHDNLCTVILLSGAFQCMKPRVEKVLQVTVQRYRLPVQRQLMLERTPGLTHKLNQIANMVIKRIWSTLKVKKLQLKKEKSALSFFISWFSNLNQIICLLNQQSALLNPGWWVSGGHFPHFWSTDCSSKSSDFISPIPPGTLHFVQTLSCDVH